jgi:glycosyltransferase involved in cell wall biosynthesis
VNGLRGTTRVLWLLRNLGLGGAERLSLEIMRFMPSVDVRLVAVHLGNGELGPVLREKGIRPRILASEPFDPRWVARLRRVIRETRPDLVHAHLPIPGIGARLSALGTSVPIVYTEHSVWSSYHPMTRWANAATLGLNDRVIAVSDEVKRSILSSPVGAHWRDRVITISNGIDLDQVRADAAASVGDISPGSYGSLMSWVRPEKGPDVLIEAAARLKIPFPERRCVIVGDGALLAEIRRRGDELGLGVTLQLVGRRMDARAIMRHLDIVVLPSRVEGLPLVLLEAMALGRPIVASAVGGVPQVVRDGDTALLVPPGDPVALAAAIERILRDPLLAQTLGRAAAAVAEGWSIKRTAEGYLAVYDEVLSRRNN